MRARKFYSADLRVCGCLLYTSPRGLSLPGGAGGDRPYPAQLAVPGDRHLCKMCIRDRPSVDQHRQITAAFEAGQFDLARERMREHYQYGVHLLLDRENHA